MGVGVQKKVEDIESVKLEIIEAVKTDIAENPPQDVDFNAYYILSKT